MTKPPRRAPGLPSRQDIIDFITKSPVAVGKREIAKAFKVQPRDRVALKGLIKDIERTGSAERTVRRRLSPPDTLPEVAVVELFAIDAGGDALGKLVGADPEQAPTIRLSPARGEANLGVGDRAVAKLRRQEDGSYEAAVIRPIGESTERILGVFQTNKRDAAKGDGQITPTDRKNKNTYRVRASEAMGAKDGDLVLAAPLPLPRLGLPHAQILEKLGRLDDPKAISLVAIHSHGIPVAFSDEAIAEAEAAEPVELGQRTDLRSFPLITIDGADARDFDDAVWAEADPEHKGGWHILVAIADVAWYVLPESGLDKAAVKRGNSVYFPDRVVPMLPEALSNELCSLKPDVDRACMAIHLWLDGEGTIVRHQVVRGLMRSVARLTYEQVQAAMDGFGEGKADALLDRVIRPLYGAYEALEMARKKRGTLDLDLPERKVIIGENGHIARIDRRQRLDSHRLIEEFMIAANVAAAETLEKVKRPCMYRVHDIPDPERMDALREFLQSVGVEGLTLSKGQVVRPKHFAAVLEKAAGLTEAPLINELVLRCQAQAVYAPENLGHFGLALQRYAHFTSPIRRYADLLVHRALIDGVKLGKGGLPQTSPAEFVELGKQISAMERRAALAERTATDRYVVAFMQDQVGGTFEGRISGALHFGLFVTLDETGADGLIPIGTLPSDYYHHDAKAHTLLGQRSNRRYALGDRVTVKLREADPVAGGLVFSMIEGGTIVEPGKHKTMNRSVERRTGTTGRKPVRWR